MIVHIVNEDRFTKGYVKFMLQSMNRWEHKFFVLNNKEFSEMENNRHIIQLSNWKDIGKKENRKLLEGADQIIISGAFFVHHFIFLFPPKAWDKTYIQFWGGDFYDFKQSSKISRKLRDSLRKIEYCKAKGLIFLIDYENEQFEKIIGVKKKSYVAPMPNSPDECISYHEIWKRCTNNHFTVLIGNSATASNNHFEAIDLVKKYGNEIKIYCPLSYGDDKYKGKVIAYGKQVFGEQFIPITEQMEKGKYVEFLSNCDVGIFNNNRQQAMGNINLLLYLGKKVFLKRGTSMWNAYTNANYSISAVDEILDLDLKAFFEMDDADREYNHKLREDAMKQLEAINHWTKIFEEENAL